MDSGSSMKDGSVMRLRNAQESTESVSCTVNKTQIKNMVNLILSSASGECMSHQETDS